MKPGPDADPACRLRRLSFDLTGLPPSLEELRTFVANPSPEAWHQAVDRLLNSPRFGEHWGRHWLDVVRFAESVTLRGFVFREAWRYRDYVIDAFSRDLPFDRLIQEQLAGDLLPSAGWEDRARQQIATTFLALGNTNLEEQDKQQLEMDVVDEQLDTLGKAFLGQTLGCARCHDHKFDPIPIQDYYALAGILKSVRSLKHANVSEWIEQPLPVAPEMEEAILRREQRLADLKERVQCYRQAVKGSGGTNAGSGPAVRAVAELKGELAELERVQTEVEAAGPRRPRVMTVVEEKPVSDLRIHRRGSVHSLGEVVKRGFLQVAPVPHAPLPSAAQSGRKELAEWIASPQNPLTARVYVNRIWHWLIGEGLVRTLDNFGTTGERPSHPELLDFLARRFIETGWSTKQLVRLIVQSRVYQLASGPAGPLDVDNRWLRHAHRRPLQAEQLRDTLLLAAGRLEFRGGGATFPVQLASDYGFEFQQPSRSVYAPIFRNALPEMLQAFDFPPPMMVSGRREHSLVPSQALFLLNHPFVREQAKAVAQRLLTQSDLRRDAERISWLYLLTLGREASPREREVALAHLQSGLPIETAWTELAHALFASADFRYLN